MLEIRKGTEKDIPELMELLDYVRNSMEQKEWLFWILRIQSVNGWLTVL